MGKRSPRCERPQPVHLLSARQYDWEAVISYKRLGAISNYTLKYLEVDVATGGHGGNDKVILDVSTPKFFS